MRANCDPGATCVPSSILIWPANLENDLFFNFTHFCVVSRFIHSFIQKSKYHVASKRIFCCHFALVHSIDIESCFFFFFT